MQGLQTIVSNLTLLLFFGFFMELLLPNSRFKGYLKVVLGLFIVITLLTPMMEFLHQEIELNLPLNTEISKKKLESVIYQSKKLENKQEEIAFKAAKTHLEGQIEGMLSFAYGIVAPDVILIFEGENPYEQQISQVKITLNVPQQKSDFGEIEFVERVVVDQKSPLTGQRENIFSTELVEQIRASIGAYLNLEPKKINILIQNV